MTSTGISWIIAGLGNPGAEYETTRHNCGFLTIEALCDKLNVHGFKLKQKGMQARVNSAEGNILLVKPNTYMNNSGECLQEIAAFYKLPLDRIIVIYDDIDLPAGEIRVRSKGGPGTHNGMRSAVRLLGGEGFPRVRVGIGKPLPQMDLADYVSGHFTADETPLMRDAVMRAADAALAIVQYGTEKAMQLYNGKAGK